MAAHLSLVTQDGERREIDSDHPEQKIQQHLTEGGRAEADWTLRKWFEHLKETKLAGRAKSTMTDYRTYLKRWDSFFSEHRTRCPVLREISPATLNQYWSYLVDVLNVPAQRADKHVAGISTLLGMAERDWILPRKATLDRRAEPSTAIKFVFTVDELRSIYRAAEAAVWPAQFLDGRPCKNPSDYWRAFVVGGWTYGFRSQEWWAYESVEKSLEWPGVHWRPLLDVEGRQERNPHGWLTWTQQKTGRTVHLPMSESVRACLEQLRRGRGRVFDFPRSSGTNKPGQPATPQSGFYGQWWELVRLAGLDPKMRGAEHLTHCPKHFRKTAYTTHRAKIGDAANWITGHKMKGVGPEAYWNCIAEIRGSINALEPI